MSAEEQYHAKTLKGLEALLAEELKSLGALQTQVVNRGVNFKGGRALLYRTNLASRLALRILLPILRFQAHDEESLYRRVRRFDWSPYLDNRMTFSIDPVVHSPQFRNSHFVALRIKDAIADQFREKTHLRPSVDRDRPDVLLNVHISGSWVNISLDSSGGSLHKRGYRTGTFEAPLNEVLAAGMVMLSGWNGQGLFIDPMCGSGTLAIEAALYAAKIPPGIFRKHFGFETWKDFDRELLEHVAKALPAEKELKTPIIARDLDPQAVELTRQTVRKMELDHLIQVEAGDFAEMEGREEVTLIMNPPYGERMRPADIDALYGMIGSTLKHRFPGSDAWILSSSKKALAKVGLKADSRSILYNGALECSYVHYRTFRGSLKDFKQKNPAK